MCTEKRCPQGQEGRGRGTFRRNYRSRGRSQSYRARGRGVSTKETANTIEERIALYAAHICSETQGKVSRQSTHICSETQGKVSFVLDSGASNHFVREDLEKYMDNIKILPNPVSVYIANGEIDLKRA
ncbi:hypothetical protein QE152_g27762 [Popillia japonica]|uniref:Uncharacterized protein n=1 Tax=Popillia japonica TaxID=7064 RepID=A0AAW1JNX7_POPJA